MRKRQITKGPTWLAAAAFACALAAFGVSGGHTASAQAPGAPKPTAEAMATVAQLVGPSVIHSTALSSDGTKVVGLRQIQGGQAILVIDLATRKASAVQTANAARGQTYNAVWWVGDRIVSSVTQFVDRRGRLLSRAEANADPTRTYVVDKLFSMNADGSGWLPLEGDRPGGVNIIDQFLSVSLVSIDRSRPDSILVAINDTPMKLWRMNTRTGASQRLLSGEASTGDFILDGAGEPVIRVDFRRRGEGAQFFRRAAGSRDWVKIAETRTADALNSPDFQPIGPGPGSNQVYVIARPQGQDRAALYLLNTATGAFGAPVFEHPTTEVTWAHIDPRNGALLAGCVIHTRQECSSQDPAIEADFAALRQRFGPDVEFLIDDASHDQNTWLVRVYAPQLPGTLYSFDRTSRQIAKVTDLNPALTPAMLAPTRIAPFQARDGVRLWSYVTGHRRPGDPPSPVVLLPHGGPEARDYYGFDPLVQLFARRGYLVVQPHFRGSEGSGKAFVRAGQGQWGLRMQDDVIDAFNAVTASGEGDAGRACIVGWSYGGYAALMGMARDPGLFRCGASVAGVSDLPKMLEYERNLFNADRSGGFLYWRTSIGELGRDDAKLAATSPARMAGAIQGPILLIHGDEDTVVPVEQSRIMAAALKAAGKPHETLYLDDGDHGLTDFSHAVAAHERLDAFVAKHLDAR